MCCYQAETRRSQEAGAVAESRQDMISMSRETELSFQNIESQELHWPLVKGPRLGAG